MDDGTAAKIRLRLTLRVVALAFMAVICVVVPSLGPNRFWVAAFMVLLVPGPLLLPRLLPDRRWMAAQSLLDVGAVVVVVALAPQIWAAGLVVVLCSPFAWSALLGRNTYVVIEATGLAGLGLVAILVDLSGWIVPLVVAAMMIPLLASFVDAFLTHELTAAQRLDDVARSSSAVFWEVDARTGAFASVSGQVEEVFGQPPEELPGDLPELLVEPDRRRWWEQVLEGTEDQFVLQCRLAETGTGVTWLRLHVRRESQKGRHLLRGIAFDVTELAEIHEEIRLRADTDQLTELPNRWVLLRELEHRVELDLPFALFLLDLDHFKDVNDTLGHQAGDTLLQVMARRLVKEVGDHSMVARMGGDEFAVIVDADAGLDRVVELAHDLVTACEMPVEIAAVELASSASCGVAVSPLHGDTAEDLLRQADLAMYTAKRSGVGAHLFEFATDQARITASSSAARRNRRWRHDSFVCGSNQRLSWRPAGSSAPKGCCVGTTPSGACWSPPTSSTSSSCRSTARPCVRPWSLRASTSWTPCGWTTNRCRSPSTSRSATCSTRASSTWSPSGCRTPRSLLSC